jgi:hypothetical protein
MTVKTTTGGMNSENNTAQIPNSNQMPIMCHQNQTQLYFHVSTFVNAFCDNIIGIFGGLQYFNKKMG